MKIVTSLTDSISHTLCALQWRHNERKCISKHQRHDCLLNRLFRHRWQKTSKFRVTGLWEGNSPVTGEFPAQRASNAENVSIRWRYHDMALLHTVHGNRLKMWYICVCIHCVHIPCIIHTCTTHASENRTPHVMIGIGFYQNCIETNKNK